MNELAPFRRAYDAVADPDEGAVRAAREELFREIARDRSPSRARPRRRAFVVALGVVALVGTLLVTSAFGFGDRLLDLVRGEQRPPEVSSPVWSPDGRTIAFLSIGASRELRVMNADGSGERVIARNATPPSWSPDGRWIAFSRLLNGQIYVVGADGSGLRRLTHDLRANFDPVWAPDGRKLVYTGAAFQEADWNLYVVNADASGQRLLTQRLLTRRGEQPAWSPDGRRIAFVSRRDGASAIYTINADGSGLRRVAADSGPSGPVWSHDGQRLVFVRRDAGPSEIYVVNADGSSERRLTKAPGFDTVPVWSPDDRKLAFARERDGNWEIYVMNADGSGQRNLTRSPAADSNPVWSPDGRKLTFLSKRDGAFEVYVMNGDGSGQRRLTRPGT